MQPLRICALASEAAPFAKTGGLADVTAALTKHLQAHGHDVRLFMPLYGAIDRKAHPMQPASLPGNLSTQVGPHRFEYSVFTSPIPGSAAQVYFIDCPVLFDRGALYTSAPDEHLRFLMLTRAAIECCQHMAWSPHILHSHDWHSAFAPLLLRQVYGWDQLFAATRSVLTIHNIGYQGVFGADRAADLGLGDRLGLLHQDDLRAGHINALKHGCLYADAITTVSPTYAKEILTPELGMGLQDVLNQRVTQQPGVLSGILNGVDYTVWDPRTDPWLDEHYDASRLATKAQLKHKLLAKLGLPFTPATPASSTAAAVPPAHASGAATSTSTAPARPGTALVGMVSRLAVQKGIELVLGALPKLLETHDLTFVSLGAGDPHYEQGLRELQARFPRQVVFHQGYSEELAHWIEAASDLFLMPSQYEPCGLNQMYSLRYGTVPVVRRTGGLADSVQRYDPGTGRGTGVLFDAFTPEALGAAVNVVLGLRGVPRHWDRLVRNGMAEDFSWERQGAQYVTLYRRLSGAAAEATR